jgi:hypothetical protein
MGDQVSGELKTLKHPSRERLRGIIHAIHIHLDPLQPFQDFCSNLSIMAKTKGHEAFSNIGAGTDSHAEPLFGILVNHSPFCSHEVAPFGFGNPVNVDQAIFPVQILDRPGRWFHRARKKIEKGRLSGA